MTGEEILRKWQAFISRYCACSPAQSLVLALWAIHTWLYEKYSVTPYLEVYAATRGAGKTRVLEVLALLCRGPETMATTRIAPIVRLIAEHQGKTTLLIDEAEKLGLSGLSETRSALATGYRSGASHPVTTSQGVIRFSTYAPKAFALIGNIQPILRDRAIPIFLKRGKPTADLLAERPQAVEQAEELKTDLFRFDQANRVFVHPPMEIPDWLYGRNAEIWTPLWSIALALKLHKQTYEELQAASVDLSALKELPALPSHSVASEEDQADLDAAERLLLDSQSVLTPADKGVPTEELLRRLRAIPTAPWRTWRGKGLDAILLSALLDHFGVGPVDVQVGKGRKDRRILKGYKADALRRAKPSQDE